MSPTVIEMFGSMLSQDAEILTNYGATEALPLTAIGHEEVLTEASELSKKGYGMCVGRPLLGVEIQIITINDDPIESWSNDLLSPRGEIGEIVVAGNVVSKEYYERPEENELAKIKAGNTIWHRMGDVGWMDEKNRLWYCGRKKHRVVTGTGTLFSINCEAIFNQHPRVFRSALVGIGASPNQKPVICIELKRGDKGKDKEGLKQELLQLARANELTKTIEQFLFPKVFPVDIRHNAKILREQLAFWVEKELNLI